MKVILIILGILVGIVAVVAILFYLVKFIIQLLGLIVEVGWGMGKYIVLILLGLGALCLIGWLIAEFA